MSRNTKITLRTDRFAELKGIDDDVEKALQDKQKNRAFKDAGKRVHGSRKEQAMYSKLIGSKDLNNIEQDEATAIELIKKDKVFPKIDAQLEKENGTDSGCAFLKSKIRQAYPAKPYLNTKESRAQYVKMAEAIHEVLSEAIVIDDLKKLYTIATNEQIVPRTDFTMLFGKKLRNIVSVLYGYSSGVGVAKKTLIEARQYSGVSKETAAPLYKNLKTYYDKLIEKQQKCIDSAKQIISSADLRSHKYSDLTFRGGMLSSMNSIPEYVKYVESVCTRFINDYKREFNTKKELFPYKEFKPDWSWGDTKRANKSEGNTKPKIEATPLSYIKRTGGLFIEQADEQTVIHKLHFKSITLGNYVKDNEAQEHIRHFVASIVDLCEILDIDLSINKKLAIGFGAFGRGGKAMATYYPTRQLINLTKRNGDGSVAHEWGHFFDHFLNEFGLSRLSLLSETTYDLILEKFGRNRTYLNNSKKSFRKAYFISTLAYIIETGVTQTPFHKSMAALVSMLRFGYDHEDKSLISFTDAQSHEKKSTDSYLYHYSKQQGSYWKNTAELFARSFECYIYDKLKEKNRENNYLVSGGMFAHLVYPQGKERTYINKCFDNLIEAAKVQFKLKSFTPFTKQRADEYIDLTEKGRVNKGVIVGTNRKLALAKIRAKAIRIKQKQALTK
ncbi:LPD1 domain-containing protein [Saccharicrinis aurantiacus]|uniref:LPD1 domain-containing protein n=1 Tax=Saccharicrinis aurantiacus TaxID=1849719 RepID=UPI000838F4CC|nr:LPD1 domain-containing protein [Saccharicrinis aurantiacus]